jgi:hypothetical protein
MRDTSEACGLGSQVGVFLRSNSITHASYQSEPRVSESERVLARLSARGMPYSNEFVSVYVFHSHLPKRPLAQSAKGRQIYCFLFFLNFLLYILIFIFILFLFLFFIFLFFILRTARA